MCIRDRFAVENAPAHPPVGYAADSTKIHVDASYREDQRERISLTGTVRNAPVRVQVNLMDYYTEEELDGAQMTVLDSDGNAFTTFLTVHEGLSLIHILSAGIKQMTMDIPGRKSEVWRTGSRRCRTRSSLLSQSACLRDRKAPDFLRSWRRRTQTGPTRDVYKRQILRSFLLHLS